MDWTYNCTLDYAIGTKYVYSDLSFILLGEIAERIRNSPLEVLVKQNMVRLEIHNTSFLPSSDLLYRMAPTEYSCTDYLIQPSANK